MFIDQVASGTPLEIDEIEPGLYDISIRSDRYLDFDSEIAILGQRQQNTLVAPLSAWAVVTVDSNPSGATISVEGESLGETPASAEILQGYRSLEISKPGYNHNINVEAGVDQALASVLLEKADGTISLRSNPVGANVTLNGRYRGQTPLSIVLGPNQSYDLELSKAGFESFRREIAVRPDEDLVLDEDLQPLPEWSA